MLLRPGPGSEAWHRRCVMVVQDDEPFLGLVSELSDAENLNDLIVIVIVIVYTT